MAWDDEPANGLIIVPDTSDDAATIRQMSAHLEYLHPEAIAGIRTLFAGIYREMDAGRLDEIPLTAHTPVALLLRTLQQAINHEAPEGLFFGCIEGRETELGWWEA